MFTLQGEQTVDILIVEDNLGDVALMREGLETGTPPPALHVVQNGVEALQFLRREENYAQATKPDVILLDLNLPKKDGMAVLAEIKADASLRTIPVIVFTSSRSARDIVECYDLHANSYITKPSDLDGFFGVMKAVYSYWSDIVELPGKEGISK